LFIFSALLNGGEKIDERKKLQLAPRTIETTSSDETQQPSSEPTTKLSDDAIKRKSKNILEEYFGIRDKRVSLQNCITVFFNSSDNLTIATYQIGTR
jgi:translation initiation factor 4G